MNEATVIPTPEDKVLCVTLAQALRSILPLTTARDVSIGSLLGFCLNSASKIVVHRAHIALHNWVLPLGRKNHSNPVPWCTRISCGQIARYSARHRHERDGNDLRLRCRSLSMASFAEGPLLFSQAPDAQDQFLAFDFSAPHSLTQTVHALNNEGTHFQYAVDVSPSARVYQPVPRSQV